MSTPFGKFKLDGNIFSSYKIKKVVRDSNARPPAPKSRILSAAQKQVVKVNAWSIGNFIINNLNFLHKEGKKTRDLQKK